MKRQPEGIPAGGQFAADRKDEPTGALESNVRKERPEPNYAETATARVSDFAAAYGADAGADEVVRGVIGDLHHYATKHGVDIDVEMVRGRNYFQDEVRDDAQLQHSQDLGAQLELQGANRERLFMRWNEIQEQEGEASELSPEGQAVDAALQRADVQVMATALRAHYPHAESLTIRENEDGENQYDILEMSVGGQSIKNEFEAPLIADELYGGGPYLDEAVLHLNRLDDTWAEGIAENISNKLDGKMFRINLTAASNLPAPQVP